MPNIRLVCATRPDKPLRVVVERGLGVGNFGLVRLAHVPLQPRVGGLRCIISVVDLHQRRSFHPSLPFQQERARLRLTQSLRCCVYPVSVSCTALEYLFLAESDVGHRTHQRSEFGKGGVTGSSRPIDLPNSRETPQHCNNDTCQHILEMLLVIPHTASLMPCHPLRWDHGPCHP